MKINKYNEAINADKEYELITEAQAQLSVVGNCSRCSLCVCLPGEEKQLAGRGVGQQL
jgi:hypothetical protein